MTHNPHTSPYWTAAEVAAYLRLSVATVYREIQAGRLEALRSGRTMRVHREAVRRWEDEHTGRQEAG